MQEEPGYVAPLGSAAVAEEGGALAATPVPAAAPAPAVPAKPGDVIAWEDLPRFVDHQFEMTTTHTGKRDVLLVAASAEEITVSGSVAGGGRVQNRVYRDGFGKAVLIR